MINRYYKEGEKLDVAGLNQIIVLLDRSETEKTEIALNIWPPDLDGPPHKHDEKEQIFYFTSGKGIVKIGRDSFKVEAGNLAHIPVGVIHQTIVTGKDPLSYMLFNIFVSDEKEGHASFAEHIEKVKLIRKKQAESGEATVVGAEQTASADQPGKFIKDFDLLALSETNSQKMSLLLDRKETAKSECLLIRQLAAGPETMQSDREQSLFILSGTGRITIENETEEVVPGNLVFVPRNATCRLDAPSEDLTYLCLNSFVTRD